MRGTSSELYPFANSTNESTFNALLIRSKVSKEGFSFPSSSLEI